MTPIVLGLALTVAAPASKKGEEPPAKLDGEWVMESFEGAEKSPPPGAVIMTFANGKISVREGMGGGKKDEVGYTVDLTKKPATIDIVPGKRDEIVKGILEVKGDTLKLCFGKDGAERPTEFKGDADKRIVFITFKRAKPEK